ncbi:SDR family NAD(P)-dependent oxidoreductase [Rhodohalobacter sp. 8-1]|uniref:SDR family NAD(P)-dependent oxidoreductase n=1 Tax=Rhodohalobacter sp. 8-1 TaxID=3131972 RepID=UPI0030EEC6F8
MNKTAIITGSANGIGRAIATAFAENEYSVVIADIDVTHGRAISESLNNDNLIAEFVECDVSDPASIKNLVKKTIQLFGRIDVVINNAGLSEFTQPNELTVEDWDRVINTNLRSSFLLTREAAKEMKSNGGGSVVNIASTRAMMSEPNSEAYAASKGGLLALTHAMSISYAEDNINVNCISPGWIKTENYDDLRDIDHEQHPSKRVGKPEDIARACLFLTKPDNDFINGENLVIDGGMTRKMIYEH